MHEKGQTIESLVPFSDSFSVYLFKKTEKIVLALYLVTDHLSETDPMRVSVRKLANDVLRGAIKVTSKYASPGSDDRMICDLYELTSFLDLAGLAKVITMSNVSLITDEIRRLAKDIVMHQEANQSGSNLKKSFFVVDTTETEDPVLYKGHKGQTENKVSFKNTQKAQEPVKRSPTPLSTIKKDFVKDDRSTKIKEIIKSKGHVTIKDVADAFSGISEKTIQRELQKMVATGVLKREGERRWSTYSLVV